MTNQLVFALVSEVYHAKRPHVRLMGTMNQRTVKNLPHKPGVRRQLPEHIHWRARARHFETVIDGLQVEICRLKDELAQESELHHAANTAYLKTCQELDQIRAQQPDQPSDPAAEVVIRLEAQIRDLKSGMAEVRRALDDAGAPKGYGILDRIERLKKENQQLLHRAHTAEAQIR